MDVKETGKIQYAYLGVRYLIINAQVKDEKKLSVDYGALLAKGEKGEPAVMENSPAAKAGLREGDIILEFNGSKITQNNLLASMINLRRAGEKISLKVLRGTETLDIIRNSLKPSGEPLRCSKCSIASLVLIVLNEVYMKKVEYSFYRLNVWKLGMKLVNEIYSLTKKFPV